MKVMDLLQYEKFTAIVDKDTFIAPPKKNLQHWYITVANISNYI